MPLLLAVATDHTLTVCAIALALAFLIGVYGQIVHSRALILTGIAAIAAICLYVVVTGEAQTFS